jgi:hypothetical protein
METLIGVNPGIETDEHRTGPPLPVTSSEKVNAVITTTGARWAG